MPFATLNTFEQGSKVATAVIEEVRNAFLERVAKNPELYYDEDVARVKSKDWWVSRFVVIQKQNQEKAIDSLDKAMKWRKEFGVLELKDNQFAKETYMAAPLILYGKDVNGAQLLILRAKVAKKIKAWVPVAQKFFVNVVETAERNDNGKGVTLLLDCKGSGVKNADIDFMKFAHQVFNDYYPGLVNAGLVYKLPEVMKAVLAVVRAWLNEEQDKYCYTIGKKTINEYVAATELPDFLLGSCIEPYRTVPDGCPTAHELAEKLSIKVEKADKLVKHMEQFYAE